MSERDSQSQLDRGETSSSPHLISLSISSSRSRLPSVDNQFYFYEAESSQTNPDQPEIPLTLYQQHEASIKDNLQTLEEKINHLPPKHRSNNTSRDLVRQFKKVMKRPMYANRLSTPVSNFIKEACKRRNKKIQKQSQVQYDKGELDDLMHLIQNSLQNTAETFALFKDVFHSLNEKGKTHDLSAYYAYHVMKKIASWAKHQKIDSEAKSE